MCGIKLGIKSDSYPNYPRSAGNRDTVTCQACITERAAAHVERSLLQGCELCDSCLHGMTIPNECSSCRE